MRAKLFKRQGGFSLIEISIVLVIIGLLIGGVLKGQAMVQNSKIKRIASDVQMIQGAMNAYSDSYWMLPGDDSGAGTRWTNIHPADGTQDIDAGDGDGLIEGLFIPVNADRLPSTATVAGRSETSYVWNHLYCEGLLKGECLAGNNATTNVVQPANPAGGLTGIADGRVNAVTSPRYLGIVRKMICMRQIPANWAMIYDTQFDDGAGDSGDIAGSAVADTEAAAGTATPYGTTLGNPIVLCSGF
ncbi:MAG: prepilin-type N-terminal cleavage/methylation domain-containing protein [Magnetococcales bacterium]|nr:prepilin-type N-terminal cleavage/methylation domain-containing protein [Magnetococcales bacterium]